LTCFPDLAHHVIEDRMVEKLLAKRALSVEFGQEIESQQTRDHTLTQGDHHVQKGA